MPQETFEPPKPPNPFVGRVEDLAWLGARRPERIGAHFGSAVAIIGQAGVGKTALVAEYLNRHSHTIDPYWFDVGAGDVESFDPERPFRLREFFDRRKRSKRQREVTAVIDGADTISDRELGYLYASFRNWKDINQVIVISRTRPVLRIDEYRQLSPLSAEEMERLLRGDLNLGEITEEEYLKLQGIIKGNPEAAVIMAGMARSLSSERLRRVLTGKIYELSDVHEGVAPAKVARMVKPLIVVDNERLLKALKKKPKDLFKLTSRQFEEVVADLLQDMDYEVTLTKQTRDGGTDILAAKRTELGDVLCLVDTKKYKESRKIGVGMVRTLLGTLTDYDATNAMLATTSTYSPEAQAMQEKHKFRLSLKDYTDLVGWIQRFGERH